MRYRFVHRPYRHQRRALKRLLRQRGGGLQVPMRWGKTKVAVDFANCLHLLEGMTRALVVCPLSVVGVWEQEIIKHTPAELWDKVDWQIVNYEAVYTRAAVTGGWFAVPRKDLERWRPELIIVDESHRIGNPNTVASRFLYRLGRQAKYRLIMTGTMFHRKPFYVFGQAKFYDPGLFGTSFTEFKKRIAVMGGYGGYEVIRYINLGWMMRRMKSFVFIQKYVPPRPPAVNPLYFHLTGRGLRAYADMEKESMLEVGDQVVISPIVVSRHLRCQQIAGGWVKTEGRPRYRRVGSDKMRMGQDRINDYVDQGVSHFVVGCRFIPELADAARAAAKAGYKPILFHGGLDGAERTRRLRLFRDIKEPAAFISQINTGSMGIDLSRASVMLFWSLSESYVDHDQFSRRIEKFKDDRVLQYDFLIARGTRDEVTYEAIRMKRDVAELIADQPELVEHITSKLRHEQD